MNRRRILTIGGTVLAAAATGHIMQNGNAFAARTNVNTAPAVNSSPAIESDIAPNVVGSLPTPPMEMIVPGRIAPIESNRASRVAALVFKLDDATLTDAITPKFMSMSCDVEVDLLADANAMVALTLKAPCNRDQRVLVSHAGLEFTDITDAFGGYSIRVPALEANAVFSVSFLDGTGVSNAIPVVGLNGQNRMAVSWEGAPVLHIHAMEYGSEFGQSGHVWAENPGNPEAGLSDKGYLVTLGNPDSDIPKLAEVYTFPVDSFTDLGAVRLIVEAAVTEENCAVEVRGKTHQMTGLGDLNTSQITLAMPECDSVGGFLVLKNLLQDLKIARN